MFVNFEFTFECFVNVEFFVNGRCYEDFLAFSRARVTYLFHVCEVPEGAGFCQSGSLLPTCRPFDVVVAGLRADAGNNIFLAFGLHGRLFKVSGFRHLCLFLFGTKQKETLT